MVVWQCKSVQALPLCCGVRDAKPRALGCPGGEKGVVVAGVLCPRRPLCVTDRKLSPVRLKTPPEYPCPPHTHTHFLVQERDGWGNLAHTPRLCAMHRGFPTLAHLPISACWVGKVCQGPWELSPGGQTRTWAGGKLPPAPPQPSSYAGCSQERDNSASDEGSSRTRHLAVSHKDRKVIQDTGLVFAVTMGFQAPGCSQAKYQPYLTPAV